MGSGYSPLWRRFMQRYIPFLFKVCPQGNYHWITNKKCYCGMHCHSGDWHGGVYNFKTKSEESVQ